MGVPGSFLSLLLIVPPLSFMASVKPFHAGPTDSSETALHMRRGSVTLAAL